MAFPPAAAPANQEVIDPTTIPEGGVAEQDMVSITLTVPRAGLEQL